MDLKHPQDFLILEALHSYGRNVAPNIARTADLEIETVEARLQHLADVTLVSKIGPADESGLYEITERGRIGLRLRDEYLETEDFAAAIDHHAATNGTAAATAIVRGKRGPDASDS